MRPPFLVIVELSFAVALVLYSGWLFYFAPCATVKENWIITHTPGRCL